MSDSDLTGQRISHYHLERRLGKDGMSTVYRATDLYLQREVTLKVMDPDLAKHKKIQKRYMQGARAAARLDHPHIERVHAFGLEDSHLFIVMESVEGARLRDYHENLRTLGKYISLDKVLETGREVAEALDYAHAQGIVHCDVKPDNIIMQVETDETEAVSFRAVLTGFEMAQIRMQSVKTQPIGTYSYMAPEQCRGEEIDGRVDVYALGVMLFELTTSCLPYMPESLDEAVEMHAHELIPTPSDFRASLPPAFERVILTSLAKEPEDRFQTAGEMARALEAVRAGLAHSDIQSVYLMTSQPIVPPTPDYDVPPVEPGEEGLDRLLIISEEYETLAVPIYQDVLRIGRATDGNDIVLKGDKVAPYHARIERGIDGEYRIIDQRSATGTWLGYTRLLPNVPEMWPLEQAVYIGAFWLQIERGDPALRPRIDENGAGRPLVSPDTELLVPPRAISPADQGIIQPIDAAPVLPPPPPPAPSQVSPGFGTEADFGVLGAPVESSTDAVAVSVPLDYIEVDPGGQTDMVIDILNQGELVDHFGVEIGGLPDAWYTVPSAPLQLLPGDSGTLMVSFHPPRTCANRSGIYDFVVRIKSYEQTNRVAIIKGELEVSPFYGFTPKVYPQRIRGGGKFVLTITNTGNAIGNYFMLARDRADAVNFRVRQDRVRLNPCKDVRLHVYAKPKRRPIFGTSRLFAFEVVSQQVETEEEQTRMGEVEAPAIIPYWLMLVAVAVFAIGILAASSAIERRSASIAATEQAQTEIAQITEAAGTILAVTADAARTQGAQSDMLTQTAEVDARATETAIAGATETAEAIAVVTVAAEHDDDGDGLSNAREAQLETDPNNPDTDNDGLQDGEEVDEWGTDTKKNDTDNDGALDGEEVSTLGTIPTNPDTDNDGIFDGVDEEPLTPPTATPTLPPTQVAAGGPTELPPPTLTPTPVGSGTKRIAFATDRDGDFEIYVMDANGANLQQLTNNNTAQNGPTWSPDGTHMAYFEYQGGPGNIYQVSASVAGRSDIYVMAVGEGLGTNVRQLTNGNAWDFWPAWAPHGSEIAFVSNRDGDFDVYVLELASGDVRNLTNNNFNDTQPTWSPDGHQIAFISDRDGDNDLYVMNAVDGTNLDQVINTSADEQFPAWSPDGITLAFYSNFDEDAEIWTINVDGSNDRQLTVNDGIDDWHPVWSPDGFYIAFLSNRDGNREIYIMNAADGGNVRRITNDSAFDEWPAWDWSESAE